MTDKAMEQPPREIEETLDSLKDDLKNQSDAQAQIDKLARFIMEKVEGEPSENEGAVDCAIRIIRTHQQALNECGMTASAMIEFIDDSWSDAEQFKRSLNHLMELGLEAGKCPLPSEVLIMFCAWLTTRKETTYMGGDHDAAHVVDLYQMFIEANGWVQPRSGFEQLVKKPEE